MLHVLEGRLYKSRYLIRLQFQYRCLSNKNNNDPRTPSHSTAGASKATEKKYIKYEKQLEITKHLKLDSMTQPSKDKLSFTTINVTPIAVKSQNSSYQNILDGLKAVASLNRVANFFVSPFIILIEFLQAPKEEKVNKVIRGILAYFVIVMGVLIGSTYLMYDGFKAHELTGRTMCEIVSERRLTRLDEELSEAIIKDFEGRFIGSSNKTLSEMDTILKKLLTDNKEFIDDERFNHPHTCVLIDEKTPQQLTIYSHDFYVFTTGLMELCENVHQRAYVIANSVAHHILKHAREPGNDDSPYQWWVRYKLRLLAILANLFFDSSWFGDNKYLSKVDAIDQYNGQFLYSRYRSIVSKLLYEKELENEADRIALQLLARSCYDVRQAQTFAEKCATLAQEISQKNPSKTPDSRPSLPIANYLLRHRFDSDKVSFLRSVMDKFIQFRLECKCAPLP